MDRRTFLAGAAGLALAPQALARGRGGTPLALVTADLEEHVVAVDLTTGRVHRRIPTLAGPRAIESLAGGISLVCHTTEGAVTVIDPRDLSVRRVLRGFGEPRYAALHGRHAYITDSRLGEVAVVDLVRARVVARIGVDGPARHISVSPTGREAWTALGTKTERVAVIDVRLPARPRVTHVVRPPYLAHDVGFTLDRRVWVTSGDRRTFGVYDADTFELVRTQATGSPPQHVTFVGARAFVTSGDDGTFDVHRADDARRIRRASVPVGSYNVQDGWGVVLTPSLSQGTLCVLDAGGKLLRRVAVARSSHDACFVLSA